jgi:hypothetical protein
MASEQEVQALVVDNGSGMWTHYIFHLLRYNVPVLIMMNGTKRNVQSRVRW